MRLPDPSSEGGTDRVVTATLVLQVTVSLGDESPGLIQGKLNDLVELATNRGLITGDTGMCVDDITWHVLVGSEYRVQEGK